MLIKINDDSQAFDDLIKRFKCLTGEQYASKAVKQVLADYENVVKDKDNHNMIIQEKNREISELKGQLAQSQSEMLAVRDALGVLGAFLSKP